MIALLLLALAAASASGPTVIPASTSDASIADELSRLQGQQYTVSADGKSYVIDDIAGEGKPVVGVVERRGANLWLVPETGQAARLIGVLARPRIAGPGYKIWVLGELNRAGDLRARRLGVLAPPG